MFENVRKSLNELLERATPPEDRREVASRMRDTIVQAKMGVHDLRDALELARKRLVVEAHELETVRRRKALAEGIGDQETVQLAIKYEALHAEKVEVLTRKVQAQEEELAVAEREVEEMTADMRAVLSGATPGSVAGATKSPEREAREEVDEALGHESPVKDELDALARARGRSEREADAERKLEELKRRMGK